MHAGRMGIYEYVMIGEGLLYSIVEFILIKCLEKLYYINEILLDVTETGGKGTCR
jgi:hypothetical protein